MNHGWHQMWMVVILSCSPVISLAGAPKLHAMFVADTQSEDIAKFTKFSIGEVRDYYLYNSPEDQLDLVPPVIGADFCQETVLDKIQSLEVAPEDSILFYYIGHGYFDDETYFTPIADGGTRFPLKTITDALNQKQPRLVVTVCDCCSLTPSGSVSFAAAAHKRPEEFPPLLRRLFVESEGRYEIHSSKPGEAAIVTSLAFENVATGEVRLSPLSIFTASWITLGIQNLENELDWSDFVRRVQTETGSKFNKLKTIGGGCIRLGNGEFLTQDTQTPWANFNGQRLVDYQIAE